MDPLKIAHTCFSLLRDVVRISRLVHGFVQDVRLIDGDLDSESEELLSPGIVLDLLADDFKGSSTKAFPETLKEQTIDIFRACSRTAVDIDDALKEYDGDGLSKSAQWAKLGEGDMSKLKSSLEAHKSALETGLKMLAKALAMEIKVDIRDLHNNTHEIKHVVNQDTVIILAQIARLQQELPEDQLHIPEIMFRRCIDTIKNYGETVWIASSDGAGATLGPIISIESDILLLDDLNRSATLESGGNRLVPEQTNNRIETVTSAERVLQEVAFNLSREQAPDILPQSHQTESAQIPEPFDPWNRLTVEPNEVKPLLTRCTEILKLKGLELTFLPGSIRTLPEVNLARKFIRAFFKQPFVPCEDIFQELHSMTTTTLMSILNWCWSRFSGGIIGWKAYETFCQIESDTNTPRDSFDKCIRKCIQDDVRSKIALDLFDLLLSFWIDQKCTDFGGYNMSRMVGWWAFEINTAGTFESAHASLQLAADASSHLFFTYLQSIEAQGISVPYKNSLQVKTLLARRGKRPMFVADTCSVTKVTFSVDSESPTPSALLRRAHCLKYPKDHEALQAFVNYADPVEALAGNFRIVFKRFENTWKDGQSDRSQSYNGVLPHERGALSGSEHTSQQADTAAPSHIHSSGELISITKFQMDPCFGLVWLASMAREETEERRSAFGRCVAIRTIIPNGTWMIFEEILEEASTPSREIETDEKAGRTTPTTAVSRPLGRAQSEKKYTQAKKSFWRKLKNTIKGS